MNIWLTLLIALTLFISGGLVSAYGKRYQGYDYVEEYYNRTCYTWKAPKRRYCEWSKL